MESEPHNPFNLAFIFRDVSMTIPANKALCEWLLWMYTNHIDDLKWLHTKSQEYIKYGGGSQYNFEQWLKRLGKNLNNTIQEFN